jgi:hypothetical protein
MGNGKAQQLRQPDRCIAQRCSVRLRPMLGIVVSGLDQLIHFAFHGFSEGVPVLPHASVESVRAELRTPKLRFVVPVGVTRLRNKLIVSIFGG